MTDFHELLSGLSDIPFGIDIILRILASALAGAFVGLERKKRQKEAGIRTHCMVAIGSAVFAIVSKYGYLDVAFIEGASVDVSRVAANIVTGVCFLGTGMIFTRNTKSVLGLTTAAGIWTVSAVGLAFGSGLYNLGLFTTLLILVIQYVLLRPLIKLEGPSLKEITCIIANYEENMDKFTKVLLDIDKNMYYTKVEKRNDGSMLVQFCVKIENGPVLTDIYSFMKKYPYITYISN